MISLTAKATKTEMAAILANLRQFHGWQRFPDMEEEE